MAFASEYVRLVLAENFSDAATLFLDPLLAIHEAHLVMLARTGIVDAAAAKTIARAIRSVDPDEVRRTPFDGTHEDLFFLVESLIAARCDPEAAGRLHTARSRNDIDMTLYRMRLREHVIRLLGSTCDLRQVLLAHAARHRHTILPALTHTQPAQPTTLAHYLHAVVEQLERDATRLFAAFAVVNRSPLGACAITGTGFPIDRALTSDLLGFDGPTGNTYGSIATVDYLVEAAAAAMNAALGLGRVVQDLLSWCTAEVGYLRLGDGFVQTSSIMPQKRNPVALEHARALLSKGVGELQAIVSTVHNTPFGDIVDTEDDLQPLVARGFVDVTRGVALVAAAMGDAAFDAGVMAGRAERSWVTLTELADTLVREHGLAFAAAHAFAADLVRATDGHPERVFEVFDRVAEAHGHHFGIDPARLARLLSPEYFVEQRRTPGGPSPEEMARALAVSEQQLEKDRAQLAVVAQALADADARRRREIEQLAG